MGMRVRVIVGVRTGPRCPLSTTGLAWVPATLLARPQLLQVVAERHAHLGHERRFELAEVPERLAHAWLLVVGHARKLRPWRRRWRRPRAVAVEALVGPVRR